MDVAPLVEYGHRILPGLALAGAALGLIPRAQGGPRLLVYVLAFVLVRDAMTPVGLWTISGSGGLRIRFLADAPTLWLLAATSLGLAAGLVRFEPDLSRVVVWRRGSPAAWLLWGVAGAAAVVASTRGAALAAGVALPVESPPIPRIAAILALALAGNALEELLFRGFLQGRLEAWTDPLRAGLLSGVLFALCHSYLASTVTDAGPLVLGFTLLEGVACGLVRMRAGVLASTVTHGLTIFALATWL